MNKLALFVIASLVTSISFAFPFYKKHQIPHTFTSQNHRAELNDFSGVWVGSCRGDSEEEEDGNWEARLTITQNRNQMVLTFGDNIEDTVVLHLGQMSSHSSSSDNKREAMIQQVGIPSGNTIVINYESIIQQGTSDAANGLFVTSLHFYMVKNGESLELRTHDSVHPACVLKKAD